MRSKIKPNITNFNFVLTSIVLLMYCAIRFVKLFLKNSPAGDEFGFSTVFNLYQEKGYSAALSEGSSVLFNIAASFFNLFFSDTLLSLRFTSLFFGILSFLMVIKIQKTFFSLSKNYFILFIITSASILIVSSIFFAGINDTMIYFIISLMIFVMFKYQKEKKIVKFSLIIGLLLGCMFLTRKMSVLYLPSIFLILILLYNDLKIKTPLKLKSFIIIISVSALLVSAFNLPNLAKGKGISFHEKKLDKEITWQQLQYLTAIMNSNGDVENGQHATLDQVKQYIKKNGKESLPSSFLGTIFFDISFTVKQFFKNIFVQIIPITRLSGLVFLFLILFGLQNFSKKSSNKHQYVILFFFTFIISLCLIVINYIEPRWYVGLLILLTVPVFSFLQEYSQDKNKKEVLNFIFINVQLLFIVTINLPYIISNYKLLL